MCHSATASLHNCLQELKIGDLPSLAALPGLQTLSSLRQLSIYGCESLATIPSPLPSSLQQLFLSELRALRALPFADSTLLPQLQQLTLAACDRVAPLPGALGDLLALQQLAVIGKCLVRVCLEDGSALHVLLHLGLVSGLEC
jgi:hypothetical protein